MKQILYLLFIYLFSSCGNSKHSTNQTELDSNLSSSNSITKNTLTPYSSKLDDNYIPDLSPSSSAQVLHHSSYYLVSSIHSSTLSSLHQSSINTSSDNALSSNSETVKGITPQKLDSIKTFISQQLQKTLDHTSNIDFPHIGDSTGKWQTKQSNYWTSGFFPGCLWLNYALSNNEHWKENAISRTAPIEDQKENTSTHDIGFMIYNTFGKGYKLTNDNAYKEITLTAARSLATRYNPKVKSLQSWNGDFRVIIDNMMNIELLFWAGQILQDSTLFAIAHNHALTTMNNHIREDGSTFHMVVYDTTNGNVLSKSTVQGYTDHSTWARGQAWAIYGFSMAYKETNDQRLLDAARILADYFITHLPEDTIPFWDFSIPQNSLRKFKDSSAGSIAASGLFLLATLENHLDLKSHYFLHAEKLLLSLINSYTSNQGSQLSLLQKGAYNVNSGDPLKQSSATIWGDYYFIEAILRYENFGSSEAFLF